jgi:DNA-binding LytR/AlgR family response regulator
MTRVRVLAVDDEPLALSRISDLLSKIDGVELVGSCQSGSEAVSRVRELRPDLLLLDIEMPQVDGFDVVEALSREPLTEAAPWICFITAHPQFAPTAFETGALDFLCKPVRLARLEKTVERARAAMEQRNARRQLIELTEQLESLRHTHAKAEAPSLWLHQRGQMVRIDLCELDWVKAEAEYVRLHVGPGSFLLRGSISALADRLSSEGFVQIHRSAVVNMDRVRSLISNRGGLKVVLASGMTLPVGRKYRKSLRAIAEARANDRQ